MQKAYHGRRGEAAPFGVTKTGLLGRRVTIGGQATTRLRMDSFSVRRLKKFVEDHRARTGQMATLKDIEEGGFDAETLKAALKQKAIRELYSTLTSGAVVKVYK